MLILLVLLGLWRRIAKHAERTKNEVKKLRQDLEIIQAQMAQAQFFNLDLSGIEKKVEEDIQQMDNLVRQGFALASSDTQELYKRVEELEEEDNDDRFEELEDRIEELENRSEEIEEEKKTDAVL